MRRLYCSTLIILGLLATRDAHAQQNPRKQVIAPAGPGSTAPLSAAIRSGPFVYFSGVLGRKPGEPGIVQGGIAAEVRQSLENLRATAQLAGLDMSDMVKCTVFLADIREFDGMNKVYAEFFPTNAPARSTVGVASLVLGAKVEIECIGAVPR